MHNCRSTFAVTLDIFARLLLFSLAKSFAFGNCAPLGLHFPPLLLPTRGKQTLLGLEGTER